MKRRKQITPAVKRDIIEQAGGKCANPGCAAWRSHIHHIKHWSVYELHEPDHLIAVCPTCHDAIHHGSIKLSDETLYNWKSIKREIKPRMAHIYSEPADDLRLLVGTIAIATASDRVTIFKLARGNQLGFRILDGDIALVNLNIRDLADTEVLRVSDNHVRALDRDRLAFAHVPGSAKVTTSQVSSFIGPALVQRMQNFEPEYAANGELVLLKIAVLKPGLIRVGGCWAEADKAVVITDRAISFVTLGRPRPLSLIGEGDGSVLKSTGVVDQALFGFR